MTALEIVYVVCFVLGLAYAVFSALMGGHSGHIDGGFDAAHDVSGHVDTASDQNTGTIHFSPMSPVVIAMFVTAFGATGMICLKLFNLSAFASLPLAVLVGLAVATLTFYLFVFIFNKTQGSSESQISQLIGKEAEVITSIPANGVGEIAYTAKGARYTAPARAALQKEIKTHTIVRIDKIVGNSFFVKPAE